MSRSVRLRERAASPDGRERMPLVDDAEYLKWEGEGELPKMSVRNSHFTTAAAVIQAALRALATILVSDLLFALPRPPLPLCIHPIMNHVSLLSSPSPTESQVQSTHSRISPFRLACARELVRGYARKGEGYPK